MGSVSVLSALGRRLEGKVALITGGASGIGECTARLFSKHGAKVVIADIQDKLGKSVCMELGTTNATYVHCDVTDEKQVREAVDTTISIHGKLDIMFNNAGTCDWPKACIIDYEKAEFERVLSINLTGVFLGTKHAARVMIPARCGSIISTASVASSLGGCAPHAYTCSKHALVGLTKNAAVELGKYGIRVNCLSPFGIATPLFKSVFKLNGDQETEEIICAAANLKGVTLKAEDVAQAALYLGSDDSRNVSGHNLFIDGGFSIVNPSFKIFNNFGES